ncbi:hypothetical protein GCM10009720_28810 [Yaniella flava]|uniref:HTH cro/C1-type domain-containing protein n=2 Tax=Yaniella flava TaxID=287930 RepID=A0ABP5GHI6_9MICC
MQPQDFYASPQLFGDISARLKPEYETAQHELQHKIVAAKLQNIIAYSVNSVIKVDGRIRSKTAQNAGMDSKRLYRLLNGQAWLKLSDITGLSKALGVNLVSVAEYQGKQPVTSHNSFGLQTERTQLRKSHTNQRVD